MKPFQPHHGTTWTMSLGWQGSIVEKAREPGVHWKMMGPSTYKSI